MQYKGINTPFTFTIRENLIEQSMNTLSLELSFDTTIHVFKQKKLNVNLFHINNWLQFFIIMYNDIISTNNIILLPN